MRKNMYHKIIKVLASDKFFYFIVLIFAIQAVWLAVSAAYPMMYDEYYHTGLIDIFSKQWLPFIGSQTPEQTAIYNDIIRVPSYLFHYLLSFPYRIVAGFTDSFYIKIVSLRLINVMFVVGGLILFRKLLLLLKIPRQVIHVSFLILILVPIFPFVAAHVNYDNLLFLFTPAFLLIAVHLVRARKLDFMYSSLFVSIGLFACLVKYTFLPILAATTIYVIIMYAKNWQAKRPFRELKQSFSKSSVAVRLFVSVLLIVSIGLFIERYVYNVAKYHDVTPTCQQMHQERDCDKNYIVNRNKTAKQAFAENPTKLMNIVDYTRLPWIHNMVESSLTVYVNVGRSDNLINTPSAVTGSSEKGEAVEYLHSFMWVALTLAVIYIAYSWRQLKKMPQFGLVIAVFLVYLFAVLVYTNYSGYRKHGQLFAIQPRYFILLSPLLMAYIVQAANLAIRRTTTKMAMLVVTLVMFTQGGGMLTYIVRSNPSWYWQRRKIINTNMEIKKIIAPFIKEN